MKSRKGTDKMRVNVKRKNSNLKIKLKTEFEDDAIKELIDVILKYSEK